MEVFDRTVQSLTNSGVAVILNNHISDAMWCCGEWDENGLWYNARYSADMWLETVTSMSARYSDNLLVIGNDLRNEIRADRENHQFASWGDGGRNDWKAVATEAGNEVLKVAPNQLVIVEGLSYANDMSMIRGSPIKLAV